MKTTQNFGLRKPDQEDFYNIDDFNFNADVIDQELFDAKTTANTANQKADQNASDLAAHLADNVKHISNEERLTWNKAAQDAQPYKIFKSNKDANGIFTVVEYRREDDTLFMRSVLSNPDANGNYQTDTWTYYAADGTTPVETKVWTLTYDADGDITSIA